MTADFYPLGRALRITTNDESVLEQGQLLWGRSHRMTDDTPVSLLITVAGDDATPPAAAPTCRIRGNRIVFRASRSNRAVMRLGRGEASARFTPDTVRDGAAWRYHYLEPLGYTLIAARHFVFLHAACIARKGRAVLLCGESGAGKTCLAYAASRKRWAYVSGDATGLVRGPSPPRIVGRPFEIRFRQSALDLFPELREFSSSVRPNGKRDYELDPTELGLQSVSQASPACVVLLQRTSGAAALQPISREECARELTSAICFGDRALQQEQIDAIEQLFELPRYRLSYSDLSEAEELLWEAAA